MALSVFIAGSLAFTFIVVILKKLFDFLFRSYNSNDIPSPPAYPILKHLPYFLDKSNEDKHISKWSETFRKDGIFKFNPLLGRFCSCNNAMSVFTNLRVVMQI